MNQSKIVEIRPSSLLAFIVRKSEFRLMMEFAPFLSVEWATSFAAVSHRGYVALGTTKRGTALGGRRQWALAAFPQRALSVCCVLHLGLGFLFPRCCRDLAFP